MMMPSTGLFTAGETEVMIEFGPIGLPSRCAGVGAKMPSMPMSWWPPIGAGLLERALGQQASSGRSG